MKVLIRNGRVIDPASGRDERADVAIAAGRIVAIGQVPADFTPERTIEADGCVVAPGLVDLAARLKEPGPGALESELAAAAAGGVTSLVCPPDTDPPLDEPRRDHAAVGQEGALGREIGRHLADGHDAAGGDGDVGGLVAAGGRVDDAAVLDQDLHGVISPLRRRCRR